MNIGKLCLFTDEGKMHQVKVLDLPHGKFRDKGIPIDNVSNYSSSEEQIVMICEEEQMRYSKLLFATAQGMIKRVDGSEFQVSKRTMATKVAGRRQACRSEGCDGVSECCPSDEERIFPEVFICGCSGEEKGLSVSRN